MELFNPNQQVQNNQPMFSKEYILNALKDQNATIFLQKQLRTISQKDIDGIIKELKGIFRDIMKDKNGNYFCQDLFKECNQEQRIIILNELYQSLSEDCLDNYGTHPIQILIGKASSEIEYQLILTSFLDYNKLLTASLERNGAITIQKIIERIPDRYRIEFNFIFSSFIEFTSRTKYGIITVKKFISETKNNSVTEQVMKFIEQNFMTLAQDKYSNYLIQFLLEKWNNTPEGNKIKKLIKDNFSVLCEGKYSHHICEEYIKMISSEERYDLINTLDIAKIRASNNHYSMKILKILKKNKNYNNNIPNNLNNNNNINNQINFNPNNNINSQNNSIPNNSKNNLGIFIPNNNFNYNQNNIFIGFNLHEYIQL